MAADQAFDSKLQPADQVNDSNSSCTAAAQWRDRGSWHDAMNAMQSPNSSADHLPDFSIADKGNGGADTNVKDNSGLSNANDFQSTKFSDSDMKEFAADIKALQADLSTLSRDLTELGNLLNNSGPGPDTTPATANPDGPIANQPGDVPANTTPTDGTTPSDGGTTPPSSNQPEGGLKPDQPTEPSQTQPGDVTTPTQPGDTVPSSPVTKPGDVIPPTKPVTTPGDYTPRTPGTPFASDSIFNLPLGTGAQWMQNDQLSNAGVYINTVGNYNENIYTSDANDPLVTVTNDAASGGQPGTFQVHIPAGAVPAGGDDKTFTVYDTATNTWNSFGGFHWTSDNTATVSQGSNEPFDGSGLTQDHSNWDEGVGTLTQNDLTAGTIDHMLRMELPTTMLMSYDKNNTNNLAPFAYPQTQEDGFANNGNGGPIYSGTIPYGVTIGIPQGTPEPPDVAANPGAHMLWTALQTHGAMVRDSGGNNNNVIFQADQNVDPNDPLIQAMNTYGSEIMAATQILANQGPDSVNGGGTPVVPLIEPL